MVRITRSLCSKMLMLSESDVRSCLSMADCLKVNQQALISMVSPDDGSPGSATVPTRLGLPYIDGSLPASDAAATDWTLFKPAAYYGESCSNNDGDSTVMGMKLVSVRAKNPSRGLPMVPATIMLLDAATGIVKAILSATYLTAARTAAGSALSTSFVLQKQQQKTSVSHLVVFGAGLQAECHIDAIQTAMTGHIQKVTIVNRTKGRAEALREKISLFCGECDIVLLGETKSVNQAVSTADVIVTATNTETPLFDGTLLPSGCHICGVGSYTPNMQEVPANAVDRSHVLIDTRDAETVGDLKHLLSSQHPVTLLGEALAQTDWLQQKGDDNSNLDCTFYKAVGTAIQDVLTANLVVNRSRELQIGTEIDMT